MDCIKVGKLILSLRKEKQLTQKQLATAINISDKTVSKWERGLGCPDVSLLRALSEILGVDTAQLLAGCLDTNAADGGNMKRIKFYVCPNCGNIINSTADAEITCCGRKLEALIAKPADETHRAIVQVVDNQHYITLSHEMSKAHFISFVARVTSDRLVLVRLYPEQDAQLYLPITFGDKIYFYCNRHGLWINA